jgi:hypothetical protein
MTTADGVFSVIEPPEKKAREVLQKFCDELHEAQQRAHEQHAKGFVIEQVDISPMVLNLSCLKVLEKLESELTGTSAPP